MGVKGFDKVVQVIEGKSFSEPDRTFLYDNTMPRALSTPLSWAYVKISEGCSHECSFCSIPLIKGDYQSRSISSIVEEVETLAAKGIKEINLVSQDTTYFGREKGGRDSLPYLLKELIQIRDIAWVRILYGYPEEITDPLLEIMRESKICPYLDIPFQHEDPVLLRKMKRSMDGRRALKLLDKIRKKIPGIALRTSLIVGFPGECRKEFDNLVAFVKEARFDHLGVFTYSREKGTEAYALGDPVRESVKQERKDRIMEIQAGISAERLKLHVGREIDVLLEGTWKDDPRFLVGRALFQAPEVDGVVFIENSRRRKQPAGLLQQVEITASEVYDLRGKIRG
jgi:ribosomal protein S12 methylthiotransferase